MHEHALFRDLRAKLVEVADLERATSIRRAVIWIGALSHLDEGHLREEWPEIVRGTPAEGAQLDVVVSEDPADPRSSSLVLRSVDVAGAEAER